MAIEDKIRWDDKYQNNPIPDTPIALVTDFAPRVAGKKALDIACGMGRHSRYLASLGYDVDALDISSAAIQTLQAIPYIHAKEVDFDSYDLHIGHYDLIICTYFLKRELFPQIISALRDGGLCIYETFVYHPDNANSPSDRAFLLEPEELRRAFTEDCMILYYQERWAEDMRGAKTMKASMVAQKN
jgi:SAM-dependent methyltransferase